MANLSSLQDGAISPYLEIVDQSNRLMTIWLDPVDIHNVNLPWQDIDRPPVEWAPTWYGNY
jgi:hypothetical protein